MARQGGSRPKLCKVERVVFNALATSLCRLILAPPAVRLPRLRNETLPKVNRAFSAGGFLFHESWGAGPRLEVNCAFGASARRWNALSSTRWLHIPESFRG
jgi:hypothetical protein